MIDPTPELIREQMITAMRGFPITELLPEQRRFIALYREEYFKVGSSTEPADQPRAEDAISALYASIGKEAPRFEWGPSPRWGAEKLCSIKDSIGNSLMDPLRDALWLSFGDPLGATLDDNLRNSLKHLLGASIKTSIWDYKRNQIWDSLWRRLGIFGVSFGGGQECYWIAHHLYAADVLNVPYQAKSLHQLRLHDEVARSCGWWWPYDQICVCTNRPEILEWDSSRPPKMKRVRYRDGFEVIGSPTTTPPT